MARQSKAIAYVLDTWAIMAYLEDEPAALAVETLIVEAHEDGVPLLMSVVNVAEVWYAFARRASPPQAHESLAELRLLGIEFRAADLDLALEAASFKARYRMSLADCFAAALANHNQAELVTGDQEFRQVEREVKLSWL
jgi:predicted nucleic acid-binding protein